MTTPTQAQIEAAAKAMDRLCAFRDHLVAHGMLSGPENVRLFSEAVDQLADAQVGGHESQSWIEKRRAIRQSAIERCAQVAEQWERESYPGDFKTLLDRIRKLKDE